jgi:hypothetical protein
MLYRSLQSRSISIAAVPSAAASSLIHTAQRQPSHRRIEGEIRWRLVRAKSAARRNVRIVKILGMRPVLHRPRAKKVRSRSNLLILHRGRNGGGTSSARVARHDSAEAVGSFLATAALVARRSRERLWFNKYPNAAMSKLNREAISRINCTIVQGRYPNMTRPINPCRGGLSNFICNS